MSVIEQLEQKYKIRIVDDGISADGKRQYKIYTADDCEWENGLSYKALKRECKMHGEDFIKIFDVTSKNFYLNKEEKNERRS